MQLIDIDLRWGVPKETSDADTVDLCMRELDKCIENAAQQPFFICLLGHRCTWTLFLQPETVFVRIQIRLDSKDRRAK